MFKKNKEKVLKNFKNFGFSFGMSFLLSKTICRRAEYKTRIKAINILDKELSPLIKEYEDKEPCVLSVTNDQKNIFVFWWDGFDKAPLVVKNNVLKVQKLYPDYTLFLIGKENYTSYVTLSKEIYAYIASGNISVQTLSDILRVNLLSKYGGFWMDATIRVFHQEPLLTQIQDSGFYSLNVDCKEKDALWAKVIPNLGYVTFYMGSAKGNPALAFVRDAFTEYYKKHDFLIDYFLIDYLLAIAKRHHLGNGSLDSSKHRDGNPFYLTNCVDQGIVPSLSECEKCPQKLNWRNSVFNSDIIFH